MIRAAKYFAKRVKRKWENLSVIHCHVMKLTILLAGTNDPSNSAALADAFAEGVQNAEASDVTRIRLRELDLPHFTLEAYDDPATGGEAYVRLKDAIEGADGILVATPIWNFGVPAHLKNAIDWIGCFALDSETRNHGQLKRTPCFFLYTGGSPYPAWKGLLRFTTHFVPESFRFFGGTVAGKYYEPKAMKGKGDFGLVVDQRPQSLEKARDAGRKFGSFIQRFRESGKLPLYHRLYEWGYRKGKRIVGKL